jgi:hypothetical protein
MPKGNLVIEVKCVKCMSATLNVPDDLTGDPLVTCECGHLVGPYRSLVAALQGEAHTIIHGYFTGVTFKPLEA